MYGPKENMMSALHSFKKIDLEKDRGKEKYMRDIFILEVLVWNRDIKMYIMEVL